MISDCRKMWLLIAQNAVLFLVKTNLHLVSRRDGNQATVVSGTMTSHIMMSHIVNNVITACCQRHNVTFT